MSNRTTDALLMFIVFVVIVSLPFIIIDSSIKVKPQDVGGINNIEAQQEVEVKPLSQPLNEDSFQNSPEPYIDFGGKVKPQDVGGVENSNTYLICFDGGLDLHDEPVVLEIYSKMAEDGVKELVARFKVKSGDLESPELNISQVEYIFNNYGSLWEYLKEATLESQTPGFLFGECYE